MVPGKGEGGVWGPSWLQVEGSEGGSWGDLGAPGVSWGPSWQQVRFSLTHRYHRQCIDPTVARSQKYQVVSLDCDVMLRFRLLQ